MVSSWFHLVRSFKKHGRWASFPTDVNCTCYPGLLSQDGFRLFHAKARISAVVVGGPLSELLE